MGVSPQSMIAKYCCGKNGKGDGKGFLRSGSGRMAGAAADELAVFHLVDPVAGFGHLGVVGDEEEGFALAVDEVGEEAEDAVGVGGVEVAGRFVGQEDAGVVGQGAGNGDALLFAAGEVLAVAADLVAKADHLQEHGGALLHLAEGESAKAAHGDHDVLLGGELVHEEVELEDEADVFVAAEGDLVVGEAVHDFAAEGDAAVVGTVEQSHDVEEAALAAAGRPDDGVDAAGLKIEGDAAEDVDAGFFRAEVAVDAAALERDGGGVAGAHWPDPRRMSTGARRAARRDGK